MPPHDAGWDWFDGADSTAVGPDASDLAAAFARCFRGADGERVLRHLEAATLDRALGPEATDAELRFLEGQRRLVAAILGLVERGRNPGAPARHP